MAIKKTVVKATPTVTVETKKISEEVCCGGKMPCVPKHLVEIGFMVLTVLNTILLIALLAGQDKAESLKVGGDDNYKILKQIFTTDGYKAQQKQQIEQALQMFSNPEAAQQPAAQQPAAQQPAAQQPAAQQPAAQQPAADAK